MTSLRRAKAFTPDPQAKFLYIILKQLDLRSIDWQQVADDIGIKQGHAARMRWSRLKTQFEGSGVAAASALGFGNKSRHGQNDKRTKGGGMAKTKKGVKPGLELFVRDPEDDDSDEDDHNVGSGFGNDQPSIKMEKMMGFESDINSVAEQIKSEFIPIPSMHRRGGEGGMSAIKIEDSANPNLQPVHGPPPHPTQSLHNINPTETATASTAFSPPSSYIKQENHGQQQQPYPFRHTFTYPGHHRHHHINSPQNPMHLSPSPPQLSPYHSHHNHDHHRNAQPITTATTDFQPNHLPPKTTRPAAPPPPPPPPPLPPSAFHHHNLSSSFPFPPPPPPPPTPTMPMPMPVVSTTPIKIPEELHFIKPESESDHQPQPARNDAILLGSSSSMTVKREPVEDTLAAEFAAAGGGGGGVHVGNAVDDVVMELDSEGYGNGRDGDRGGGEAETAAEARTIIGVGDGRGDPCVVVVGEEKKKE